MWTKLEESLKISGKTKVQEVEYFGNWIIRYNEKRKKNSKRTNCQ